MVRLRVRELAIERGLNMSQLQIAAGVSMGLVRRYWHGDVERVELRALTKIARALGVNASDLFVDDDRAEGGRR